MSINGWVLVIYMSGYNGGGPTTVTFETERACIVGIEKIKKNFPSRFEGGVCVSQKEEQK